MPSQKKGRKAKSSSRGRPSKYNPEYCQEIIKFFSEKPYREVEVTYTYKNGDTKTVYEDKANDPPFFSAFARKIDVNTDTLVEWEKRHKDFSEAYKKAKELQKEFIVINGLKGTYQTAFACFTMKNLTDWRNKEEVEHSLDDGLRRLLAGALNKLDKE